MSPFDDDELRREFDLLGGPVPDLASAGAAVERRLRRARRRRGLAWAAAGTAVAGALSVVAARPEGAAPRPAATTVSVASVPSTPPAVVTVPAVPVPSPSATTEPPPIPTDTTVPATAGGPPVTPGAAAAVPTGAPAGGAPATSPSPTSPRQTSPSPTSPHQTSPPALPSTEAPHTEQPATTPVPSPATSTFSGEGGSITVRAAGGSLSLLSTDPAAGFSAEVHDSEPDRVEVRFRSADHETDVSVELIDGRMVPSVSEQGGESGDG